MPQGELLPLPLKTGNRKRPNKTFSKHDLFFKVYDMKGNDEKKLRKMMLRSSENRKRRSRSKNILGRQAGVFMHEVENTWMT